MSPKPLTSTARPRITGAVWLAASALAVALQTYGLYRAAAPPMPESLPHADKLGHLLGFAIPVALVLLTVDWFVGTVTPAATTLVVVAFAIQAVGSEAIQALAYPERTGDVGDLIADGLGIVLGVLGVLGVLALRRVRR